MLSVSQPPFIPPRDDAIEACLLELGYGSQDNRAASSKLLSSQDFLIKLQTYRLDFNLGSVKRKTSVSCAEDFYKLYAHIFWPKTDIPDLPVWDKNGPEIIDHLRKLIAWLRKADPLPEGDVHEISSDGDDDYILSTNLSVRNASAQSQQAKKISGRLISPPSAEECDSFIRSLRYTEITKDLFFAWIDGKALKEPVPLPLANRILTQLFDHEIFSKSAIIKRSDIIDKTLSEILRDLNIPRLSSDEQEKFIRKFENLAQYLPRRFPQSRFFEQVVSPAGRPSYSKDGARQPPTKLQLLPLFRSRWHAKSDPPSRASSPAIESQMDNRTSSNPRKRKERSPLQDSSKKSFESSRDGGNNSGQGSSTRGTADVPYNARIPTGPRAMQVPRQSDTQSSPRIPGMTMISESGGRSSSSTGDANKALLMGNVPFQKTEAPLDYGERVPASRIQSNVQVTSPKGMDSPHQKQSSNIQAPPSPDSVECEHAENLYGDEQEDNTPGSKDKNLATLPWNLVKDLEIWSRFYFTAMKFTKPPKQGNLTFYGCHEILYDVNTLFDWYKKVTKDENSVQLKIYFPDSTVSRNLLVNVDKDRVGDIEKLRSAMIDEIRAFKRLNLQDSVLHTSFRVIVDGISEIEVLCEKQTE